MGKIAITGASGTFGQSLSSKLVAAGHASNIILISRSPEKLAHFAEQGCEVRFGDFDEPDSLVDAVRGADKLFIISGTKIGHRIRQHKNAIDAARAAGVPHVMYTSLLNADVEGSPSLVAVEHAGTEEVILESGLTYTFMRHGHYVDAMMLMAAPAYLSAGVWITSTDGGREAMVWREDCVNSAVAVLTQPGHENKAYSITGPNLETFEEIAEMLVEVSGRPLKVVQTDDEGMYAHFDALGFPRQVVEGMNFCSDDMVSFERCIREGWMAVASDDVEKLTGQKPRSTRQFIEENAEAFRTITPVEKAADRFAS